MIIILSITCYYSRVPFFPSRVKPKTFYIDSGDSFVKHLGLKVKQTKVLCHSRRRQDRDDTQCCSIDQIVALFLKPILMGEGQAFRLSQLLLSTQNLLCSIEINNIRMNVLSLTCTFLLTQHSDQIEQ